MRREFVVTRTLLGLSVPVIALLVVLGADRSEPPVFVETDGGPVAGPGWKTELRAPEIQALWLERRARLDDLSRRYLHETDADRRGALRREMERLIEVSERDVYDLRLRNARRDGHGALAAWLEEARRRLPGAGSDPDAASSLSEGETHESH